jgi:hypothetical protein
MTSLTVRVSDPWELAEPHGSGGRRATVTATGNAPDGREALLLEFEQPIEHGGARYRRFVATPRGRGALLPDGGSAEAALYGIPGDDVPADPLSLEWWRGGLGMVATLQA